MKLTISRHIGKFIGDRRVILLLVAAALFVAGRSWLAAHPQHDPWAPLDLNDPVGWATEAKLRALAGDVPQCRAVLERSGVEFTALPPEGEGACRREDRTQLADYPLSPDTPPTTCPVAIAMELWQSDAIEPAAQAIFGTGIARIEHLGAYSCRRLYGREDGPWSQHANGNAIDIAGFVLTDGTRISVLGDWQGEGDEARFLREVRDGACEAFGIVLSPDYNAAHADHLHLDMGARRGGLCR
ncbi:extensin family protein [Qipengyuania gaetbuli]|uniref:extensin-like domain-containing protein n=1 Tax=Qipengyuania gaetbuli TaxID=266952 RepID=UPI001CD300C8|nr:extensin family protein [Qipengyuania gaetbuli]MCA0911095.1 extensin family protein [Qipengyuania gaetbuli]